MEPWPAQPAVKVCLFFTGLWETQKAEQLVYDLGFRQAQN